MVNDVSDGQPRLALQGPSGDLIEEGISGVCVMIDNDGWELKVFDVRSMKYLLDLVGK